MTNYMILIPDDYVAWVAKTPAERAEVFAAHNRFTARLDEGGHTMLTGAELALPETARTLRAVAGEIVVTDGPYAESVEQLSGFYLIESDDPGDLEETAKILAPFHPIEIRPTGRAVDDEEEDSE